MKKKLKGSLTVFFALIMTSVMTLMFAMAEGIRIYELNIFAKEYMDMSIESAFSEYNPYLWKNYRILALDTSTEVLQQKIIEYCNANSNGVTGTNFGRLIADQVTVDKYGLLTDQSGQAVKSLGIKAAKQGFAAQLVESFKANDNNLKSIPPSSVKEQAENAKNSLNNAKASLEEAKRNNPDETYPEPEEVEDNPLDAFSVMKEAIAKGVLSVVVPADKLSDKSIALDEMPSRRMLNQGNGSYEMNLNLVDRALFIDYLLTNYSYYGYGKSDGLNYEIEYLINQKASDVENLAAVVIELLALREGANFATITSKDAMRNQAYSIANTIAAFTMNEVIIEAVAVGIMAAWAFIESVLDVRLLLAGGKIPVIKTLDDWTSDVYHLSSYLEVSKKAKETENGISYRDYLMGFLATRPDKSLSIRACDVMEVALNSTEDYKNSKVDNMIFTADFTMSFVGKEIFVDSGSYLLEKKKSISY